LARSPELNKRAPRVDLLRPAVVIDANGAEFGVLLLDVSSGGFRLKVEEDLKIGEFVTLRVGNHDEFQAQIRWVLGDEAGGMFLTSADYDSFG
jgi:PilZ domain